MRVEAYRPEHLQSLLLQPAQEFVRPYLSRPEYGKVLCCAGVIPIWEGRAEAWALMAADLKRHFLAIHNATRRFLDACGFHRVEACCDAEFCAAAEWLEKLGFQYEGPLRKYTPDGRDCLRYARVR